MSAMRMSESGEVWIIGKWFGGPEGIRTPTQKIMSLLL